MGNVLETIRRRFVSHGHTFFRVLFLLALLGVGVGCFLFDRLGPMGVMLPVVTVIGIGISEVDRMLQPRRKPVGTEAYRDAR